MTVEVLRYGHVPGIRLDAGQTVPLDHGELRAVPFEEWCSFVGRHVERSKRPYERNQPVFYVDTVVGDADPGFDALEAEVPHFRQQLSRLHTALIYTLATALPNPLQSTRYLLCPAIRERERDLGQRDIEWMIYGASDRPAPIPTFEGEMLARMLARLETLDYGSQTPELLHVLDVMKMLAEPPLQQRDVVMHATMALEDVLNPDADRPLGKTFARRGAVITAHEHVGVAKGEEIFRALYRIRSKCLHGEDPSPALDDLTSKHTDAMMIVFRACFGVGQVMAQYMDRYGRDGALPTMIRDVDAVDDAAGFTRFQNGLQRPWFHS
jgi:hypothetical protein